MTKDIVHTAIDVGTSKVSTLIAHRHANGDVDVLGVGLAPSEGLRKGVVVKSPVLKVITKKPIPASQEEVRVNPRSRSARMRVSERLDGGVYVSK